MQVGRLRDRVTLQARTVTNNGGAMVSTFADRHPVRVPCQVESQTVARMERVFGSQGIATATHILTLRRWDAVRLGDRAVWHAEGGDRVLEIQGRTEIGPLRRYLVLACEERDAA